MYSLVDHEIAAYNFNDKSRLYLFSKNGLLSQRSLLHPLSQSQKLSQVHQRRTRDPSLLDDLGCERGMERKQALAAGGSFAWRGAVLSVRLAGPIRESSTSPGAEEESKSQQEPHGLNALDIPDHA